ncbi:MAG: hypothetical protein ACRELB_01970 [Polyangiaceae bacterium]
MRAAVRVVLLAAVALGSACKERPMASTAECEHLLDRYIDLRLSEDPAASRLTTEDRSRLRGKLAVDVLAEPHAKRVKSACQAEVTQAEFDCAVKAPTARAWNDCFQ